MSNVVYFAGGPHNGLMMVLPEYWHRMVFPELAPVNTWIVDERTPPDEACWCLTHVYRRHEEHRACFVYQGTENP